MSNPEQPDTGRSIHIDHEPIEPELIDEIDYEAMAEEVKAGIDRLLSATKRSNGKQISFQVGAVSRNLIAFSKACMAGIEKPRIVQP